MTTFTTVTKVTHSFDGAVVASHSFPICADATPGTFSVIAITSQPFTMFGSSTTHVVTTGTDYDLPFLSLSNVHANIIYTYEAEIDWDTNIEANCCVAWTSNAAKTTLNWSNGATVLNYGSTHAHYVYDNRNYTITGLPDETTIYFLVHSADPHTLAGGKSSDWYYFKTRSTKTDFVGEPVKQCV
jgi:hypothetical protein